MKWWNRIIEHFQKPYEEEDLELEWDASSMEEWDWDTLMKDRNLMKLTDSVEREKYIKNCLEQRKNSTEELEKLAAEYNMVTAYLKDIDEIEALPEGEAQCVQEQAKKISLIENAKREYLAKRNRLSDSQFKNMEKYEDVMPKPYQDIKEAENYRGLIKNDIAKLEGERHAYYYRRSELYRDIANVKGMVTICFMAIVVCILMLLILQIGFEMDAQIGYILTVGVGAVALTVLYTKYLDDTAQLAKTEKGINKIILLKNTVNIRYVNNKNLLDYYYMKYKVTSGKELLKQWEQYQQEKEERMRYRQNQDELEYYQKELIKVLRRYQLHDAEIWLHQTEALLNKKEMVEIRHNLIERRQKLRSQMEYNKRLVEETEKEIQDVMDNYPDYKDEIKNMVKQFERK